MVRTFTSQQKGSVFVSWPGPFCLELAGSLRVRVNLKVHIPKTGRKAQQYSLRSSGPTPNFLGCSLSPYRLSLIGIYSVLHTHVEKKTKQTDRQVNAALAEVTINSLTESIS